MIALAWLVAFVWTCALELPVYALGIPRDGRRVLGGVFLLNLTTHPWLWFAAPSLLAFDGWLLPAELLVWLAEGLLLAAMLRGTASRRVGRGLVVAGAANLLSALAGIPLGWLLIG